MRIATRLTDLRDHHPALLWDEMIAACAAVLPTTAKDRIVPILIDCENVPGSIDAQLLLEVSVKGIARTRRERVVRTYDRARLVELAAIAIAGLSLYHSGGHEMTDVALRGTSADYLVDSAGFLLEVAGRRRKSDAAAAWHQRDTRLRRSSQDGFFLCVVEFETPSARLAFIEPEETSLP